MDGKIIRFRKIGDRDIEIVLRIRDWRLGEYEYIDRKENLTDNSTALADWILTDNSTASDWVSSSDFEWT